MSEQVLPENFTSSLALGQQNEKVVAHELAYQGIEVTPTDSHSKQPFDFFIGDRSCEVKIDLRSQATNKGYLETATYNRRPDIYIHTLCYALVFTREQLEWLYNHGKTVYGGDGMKQDRVVSKVDMNNLGVPLWKFIKTLK
jgi:hypothetical protein